MAVLLMIPTIVLCLCIELVLLCYCTWLLAKIISKIGGLDKLLIILSVLVFMSIALRFFYGLLWLIDLLHGNRDYKGLHHSCHLNLLYYLPMLVMQMSCSLVNLSIWGYFIASIYFIQHKLYFLVLWARKWIVFFLVLVSVLVVTVPTGTLLLISCLMEKHVFALLVYLAVCSALIMIGYALLGCKLLSTLKVVFKRSYGHIRNQAVIAVTLEITNEFVHTAFYISAIFIGSQSHNLVHESALENTW